MTKRTLHCDCTCPRFGRPNDRIVVVKCACGRREYACGYCLESGRVTECLTCSRAHRQHDPLRN